MDETWFWETSGDVCCVMSESVGKSWMWWYVGVTYVAVWSHVNQCKFLFMSAFVHVLMYSFTYSICFERKCGYLFCILTKPPHVKLFIEVWISYKFSALLGTSVIFYGTGPRSDMTSDFLQKHRLTQNNVCAYRKANKQSNQRYKCKKSVRIISSKIIYQIKINIALHVIS